MGERVYKTVSWYLHSMNLCCEYVYIYGAGHSRVVFCSPGTAILEYGHYHVEFLGIEGECFKFVLVEKLD